MNLTHRFTLDFSAKTLIMGIMNMTPDSFCERGRYLSVEKAVAAGERLESEGADILDVGGESSRPGADTVEPGEEIRRIVPVIAALSQKLPIPISVDTYKAEVAEAALEAGASIINDISGFGFDDRLAAVAARYDVPVVVMHTRGRPKHMQDHIRYDDLMGEIEDYLTKSIQRGKNAGIRDERFIVDPGIGFGKEVEHNFCILRQLSQIREMGYPVLIGPSRKSFIGRTLDLPPEERVEGTAAAVTAGILNGADMVRVHDVKEMVRVARIADAVRGQKLKIKN